MQKPDKRAIGERIRKHREELNMSREQLSEIMGITSKFLSDIEFGLRGFSIEKLFLFSESLNRKYVIIRICQQLYFSDTLFS